MDRLREIFEELGLDDVSTFIASGNVIFSTESGDPVGVAERIERHLAESLGYDVATFLRTPPQLGAITARHAPPVPAAGGPASVYVTFLKTPVSDSLRATLSAMATDTESFEFSESEIYWLIEGKISESPLAKGVEKAFKGVPSTMRNLNTVRRLAAKTCSIPG
jgi:uncharacterized protein (DUF1697 family)